MTVHAAYAPPVPPTAPPRPWAPPVDAETVTGALARIRASIYFAERRAALATAATPPDPASAEQASPDAAKGRRDGLIPAPPGDGKLGPFNAYGLIIGTGGLAAYSVFRRGAVAGGIPVGKLAGIVAPALVAGVVGARLYHVGTHWENHRDDYGSIPKIWDGGGAIYGGVAAGTLVGAAMARRAGLRVSPLLDAAALALPIAQAIGRFGNYANQELYGGPTDLPWGLQVDPEHRPEGFQDRNSFHPTFAYEAAWNVALAGGLYGLSKSWSGRPPGALFALYLGGYGLGRFMVEGLRVDDSKEFAGLRTNQWTSVGVMAASAGALALMVARKGRVA